MVDIFQETETVWCTKSTWKMYLDLILRIRSRLTMAQVLALFDVGILLGQSMEGS